jgi:two-component system response regulator PilR (NtrC family)
MPTGRAPRSRRATTKVALVVDDQPDVREVLSEFLRSLGLIAIPVPNAASATVVSERLELDLALVNLGRADSEGTSLIGQVRGQLPAKPIIVISGDLTPGMKEDCLRAGADEAIERPVNLIQLESLVRGLLGLPG